MTTIALQQLFAGDELYLIPDTVKIATSEVAQIEILPQKAIAQKEEIEPIKVKSPTLILVNKPSVEDMVLLSKILKSVKLELEDVDLLDLPTLKGENIKAILSQKSVNQLITFGVALTKINLDIMITPYQIREVEGVRFLYADAFAELENDVARKKRLWICLQEIFLAR